MVADLKDVHITQISLGKAHTIALTNKGSVYSFGINNKGQCGQDIDNSKNREGKRDIHKLSRYQVYPHMFQ